MTYVYCQNAVVTGRPGPFGLSREIRCKYSKTKLLSDCSGDCPQYKSVEIENRAYMSNSIGGYCAMCGKSNQKKKTNE